MSATEVLPSRGDAVSGYEEFTDRIGVAAAAFQWASTTIGVLVRIPDRFRTRVAVALVCSDASGDDSGSVGCPCR
jgi:hypothetical protein